MSNQPLDSRQLRAFVAVADTGSFTVAARELFLSQSAVSHSLRALEEDVGCRLLDRMSKKVILTPAGEHLCHHAKKILKEMHQAREQLTHLNAWGSSRLRIGASTTACQHILPEVLRKFQEKFPKCHLSIEPGDTPDLLEKIHNHEIDLAVALEPRHHEQLEYQSLFTDELKFVLAPNHPWVKLGHSTRTEIPTQSYIFYSKNSYTCQMVVNYFAKENMVLNNVMELGSMEAIKEMLKLGMGVSVLAPWIVRREIKEGSLVSLPLGRRKLKREWGILRWASKPLSHPEQAFIDLCRTATGNLGHVESNRIEQKNPARAEVALTV
jgi:LysR family transcriptional regulator, low CO2-responsive transcriptional regulator